MCARRESGGPREAAGSTAGNGRTQRTTRPALGGGDNPKTTDAPANHSLTCRTKDLRGTAPPLIPTAEYRLGTVAAVFGGRHCAQSQLALAVVLGALSSKKADTGCLVLAQVWWWRRDGGVVVEAWRFGGVEVWGCQGVGLGFLVVCVGVRCGVRWGGGEVEWRR